MAEKPTRGRASKVWLLPEAIRNALNEMLRDINAVSEARLTKAFHEIQLLQEIYKLKNINNF
mgnify:CR=1 FL=1